MTHVYKACSRLVSNFELFSDVKISSMRNVNFFDSKKNTDYKFDNRKWTQIYDYQKSSGNFVVDIDNNTYLDMFNNIATVPIGYNNPKLNNIIKNKLNNNELLHLITQRYSLGIMPNKELPNIVNSIIDKIAPKNCSFLHMGCGCGSGANENAFKAAFLHKYAKEHGYDKLNSLEKIDSNKIFTDEQKKSCMIGLPPGMPDYKILSFKNGFHGRTLGCLSATRTKWLHKVGIPGFKWPSVDFPNIKYPLEDYLSHNVEQETNVLNNVDELLKKDDKIAAMIVEPILSEGGDLHASDKFYRDLREICYNNDVSFIVDEVQTGFGPTGKLWAHEHWNLEHSPDIVTFAKKAQISGFFCNDKYLPLFPYMIFNTWMGDSLRSIILNNIIDIINQDNLIENTRITGNYLYSQLDIFQKNGLIKNLRGNKGTYIAFDPYDNYLSEFDGEDGKAQTLAKNLKENGVIVGLCGANSIRLRPSLILEKYHVDIFMNKLEKCF